MSKSREGYQTGNKRRDQAKEIVSPFPGWQEGYGAFTYTRTDREKLIIYVRNQEAHHQTEDFIKEYLRMLDEAEIDYEMQYVP